MQFVPVSFGSVSAALRLLSGLISKKGDSALSKLSFITIEVIISKASNLRGSR